MRKINIHFDSFVLYKFFFYNNLFMYWYFILIFQVNELSKELDDFRDVVPDLEDKIVGLQAETDSQDSALRYVAVLTKSNGPLAQDQ